MRELPIIFNTEMVKAILRGDKVCTRRPVKLDLLNPMFVGGRFIETGYDNTCHFEVKPPYQVGDLLYVRETWCDTYRTNGDTVYYASWTGGDGRVEEYDSPIKWKPSIHMPKKYARIWLKVTGVRVERVQDIKQNDAKKEGIHWEDALECNSWSPSYNDPDSGGDPDYVSAFGCLWNSLYKNWNDNPWVWVIDFEVVKK